MSLSDQDRQDRDPAALQRELLEIERMVEELGLENVAILERVEPDLFKKRINDEKLSYLKQRQSLIQSTLKSLRI